MKTSYHKLAGMLVALGAGAALFSGCGTPSGYKQADKTGAGIAEFRESIIKAKTSVDNTVKSLNDIAVTADTNPRKAYEQFSENVNRLESDSAKAKKSAAATPAHRATP